MKKISVRPATSKDKAWIKDLMKREWSTNIIVSKGKVYEAEKLPGFIAELDGKRLGLITYSPRKTESSDLIGIIPPHNNTSKHPYKILE